MSTPKNKREAKPPALSDFATAGENPSRAWSPLFGLVKAAASKSLMEARPVWLLIKSIRRGSAISGTERLPEEIIVVVPKVYLAAMLKSLNGDFILKKETSQRNFIAGSIIFAVSAANLLKDKLEKFVISPPKVLAVIAVEVEAEFKILGELVDKIKLIWFCGR